MLYNCRTAFFAALLLAGPATKLAGDGLQAFYASENEEEYEVAMVAGTDVMEINLLPPAKGESLSYAVTPQQACLVFAFLTGTAMISVLVSSGKMLRQKPGEILGKK